MAKESNDNQPRLPLIDVPPEIEQKIRDLGGRSILNLHKILSHHPTLLSSYIDFAYTLRNNCTSSRQLRELMILRGAQLVNSKYQWHQHEQMAKQFGISEEQINSISEWQTSLLFDDKEKVVLDLMETLILTRGKIRDTLDAQLKKNFTTSEYVELVLTGSYYAMVPIVLEALQVPIEI